MWMYTNKAVNGYAHNQKCTHTHKIITQYTHVHSHTHTHSIYTLIQANSHMNAHKETEGSAVKRRKEGGKIEIYVSIVLVLRWPNLLKLIEMYVNYFTMKSIFFKKKSQNERKIAQLNTGKRFGVISEKIHRWQQTHGEALISEWINLHNRVRKPHWREFFWTCSAKLRPWSYHTETK